MRVAKGKTSGFHHPEPMNEHLVLHKNQRNEITKLEDKMAGMCKRHKDLSEHEDKTGQEFVAQSAHESQLPKLGQVLKLYGESQIALSSLRFQFLAVLEGAKDEWKAMDSVELKALNHRIDNCNRSLCTWQYHQSSKDEQKAKDEDIRYQSMCNEIVQLVQELRMKKEALEPQLCLRILQAQVLFFRQATSLMEKSELDIRTLGPVTPVQFTGFSMPPSVQGVSTLEKATQANQEYSPAPTQQGYAAQPGYAQQPGPGLAPPTPAYSAVPPPAFQGRARALYPFVKQNPPELSFNPGDILNLITTDGQWWMAELNGQQGLIPFNYVERI